MQTFFLPLEVIVSGLDHGTVYSFTYPCLCCQLTPPSGKETSPIFKTVKTWPEVVSEKLQDCFKITDWSIFQSQYLEEYTTSVFSYMKHCTDTVTIEKHISVYANQKLWMTRGVKTLLKERNTAYRSVDVELYSAARENLKKTASHGLS